MTGSDDPDVVCSGSIKGCVTQMAATRIAERRTFTNPLIHGRVRNREDRFLAAWIQDRLETACDSHRDNEATHKEWLLRLGPPGLEPGTHGL